MIDRDELKRRLGSSENRRILSRCGFDLSGERGDDLDGILGPKALGEGDEGNFSVDLQEGRVKDWGSTRYQGDVLDVVQDTQGLDFKEALRWIVDELNLDLEPKDSNTRQSKPASGEPSGSPASSRGPDPVVSHDLASTWSERLMSDESAAEAARRYLKDRALTGEVLKAARVGLAHQKEIPDGDKWGGFYRPEARRADWWIMFPVARREKDGSPIVSVKGMAFDAGAEDWKRNEDGEKIPSNAGSVALWDLVPSKDGDSPFDSPVVVCEGEVDALCALSHGFNAVTGTGGAGTFKDEWAPYIAGMEPAKQNGVIVAYDGDEAGRANAPNTAEKLHNAGLDPRIVPLPDDTDVNDILVEKGESGLHARIAQAETYAPSELEKPSGEEDSEDLTSQWEQIREAYWDGDKQEARTKATALLRNKVHVATHRKSQHMYVWDSNKQIYRENGERDIEEILAEHLQVHWTQHESNEIITRLSHLTYTDELDGAEMIPVQGSDLEVEVDDVTINNPTPDRIFTARSEAEWDPNAAAPRFQGYLQRVVKEQAHRETLQEYVGYALMHWGLPHHKALFLVGPTQSGKSTFLDVVTRLLGDVCHNAPHQLVDSRFETINLEGSWANIRADISSQLIRNIGNFKEIVAGDPVFAERKHESGYMIRPTTKHFYSANRLPQVKIDDDAFFRRVLIVPFPESIPDEEKDTSLGEKLQQEMDGILGWAIEGLQRLLKHDGFSHDLPPQQTRKLWESHSSSIGQWKSRYLKITGDNADIVTKEKAYSEYARFCQEEGLSTESKQELTKTLTSDPRITDARRTPPGADTQSRCYVGIRLQSEAEFD